MKSVFREEEWRKQRHFLNPSKFKEYEIHAVGLGFLNRFNFLKDYKERFTHIDPITEEALDFLHGRTTIHLIRKEISPEEKSLLRQKGFKLSRVWATFILDTSKGLNIDKGNMSIIRKGEKELTFEEIKNGHDMRAYYDLFRKNRKEEGFGTASFREYAKLSGNPHYKVFVAKKEGRIVAGIGTISNGNYLLQLNIARDKGTSTASDFCTYGLICYCREKGIRWFDFAGVNPAPVEGSKDYFIRKYKAKWGGEHYNEYIYKR